MTDDTTLRDAKPEGLNSIVYVPVPSSELSGIWITEDAISGLVPGRWTFISGTLDHLCTQLDKLATSR